MPGHGVYLSEWGEGPSRALSVTPPYRNQNVQNFLTYIDSYQRADHEYVSPKSQLAWVKELMPQQAALGAPVSLCSKNSAGTCFFAQPSGRTLARWRRGPGFEPRPAEYFPRLFWPIPPPARPTGPNRCWPGFLARCVAKSSHICQIQYFIQSAPKISPTEPFRNFCIKPPGIKP